MQLKNCPDCNAAPGRKHEAGFDVERCSSCGGQRLKCDCKDHDPPFSRWTGIWPGAAEAEFLNMTINDLYETGIYKALFVKPKE